MITRAQVIRRVNLDDEYLWYVNIPILNGIPDSLTEVTSYKKLLNVNIKNNDQLKEKSQKSKNQIAQVTSEQWGTSNQTDTRFTTSAYLPDFSSKQSEFVMEARLCGIPGMQNLIQPGDIVVVGFEDNDMGNPIILGHLLTKSLEQPGKAGENQPAIKCSSITVNTAANLPSDTVFNLRPGLTLSMSDLAKLWDFYTAFTSQFATGITGLLDVINNKNNDSKD